MSLHPPPPPIFEVPVHKFTPVSRIEQAYAGVLNGFGVSPNGRWILASSTHGEQNLLSVTDVVHARVYGRADLGNDPVTSLCWTTGIDFVFGSQSGRAYLGRLQTGKEFLWATAIECGRLSGPITSIAFNKDPELLALASGCEVVVLQRDGAPKLPWEWKIVHRFEPFPQEDQNTTCMAFFRINRPCLFVGSRAGAVAVSLEGNMVRTIFGNYDHKIANCVVSVNGLFLVTSTFNNSVIIWTLRESGPQAHTRSTIELPAGSLAADAEFVAPITITGKDMVVNGTYSGELHFIWAVSREDCGHVGYDIDATARLKAFATCNRSLYVAATRDDEVGVVTCFSVGDEELAVSEPKCESLANWERLPFIISLREVLRGPNMLVGNAGGTSLLWKYRYLLGCLTLVSLLAASSWASRHTHNMCEVMVSFDDDDIMRCLVYYLFDSFMNLNICFTNVTVLDIANNVEDRVLIIAHAILTTVIYWCYVITLLV